MKIKRLLLIYILTTLCFSLFAESGYAIKVISADKMDVKEQIVILTGNVQLEIETNSEKEEQKKRKLSAQKVVFNLDGKILHATGTVHLEEGEDSQFNGEALSLNWDTLDVVVFKGGSTTDRNNAQGTSVKFNTYGNRVSYEGETDSVFFENGVVATRAEEPYWSIRAKEIAMANSDLFFKNATFRMGRVPVMWFPVFFYPGARLAINPAIGISSDKGMFINTTFELYGVYPKIGAKESSSEDDEDNNTAGAFFAFMQDSDNAESIRDGLTYRKLKQGEKLSPAEEWARKTGSYFAVFADAYENNGISVGYDTKNRTNDSSLSFDSTGLLAFRNKPIYDYYDKLRYALDFDIRMKVDKSDISLSVPLYSDPRVKSDFLNRNTVFGLDAVFGAEQSFPSTFSDITEYDIKLMASSGHSIGNSRFNINNISSDIRYKWDSDDNKFKVTQASFPYISVSMNGNIFNINKTVEKPAKLSSELAEKFHEEYENLDLTEIKSEGTAPAGNIRPLEGPAVKTVREESSSFKMDFSYSQNLDNKYEKDFRHTALNTNIYTALNLSGKIRDNLFSFTESVKPDYSATIAEGTFNTTKFKVLSVFSASIPVAGLTYNLSQNVYISENKEGKTESRFGEWDKNDISVHSISFYKTIGSFAFKVNQTLKPLTETLNPSVSFSDSGYSASYSTYFDVEGDTFLDRTKSNINFGLSKDNFNFNFSNSIDHKKDNYDGYTGTQNMSVYLFGKQLRLSEKMSLEKDFKLTDLTFNTTFRNLSASIDFTGEECEKKSFSINYKYNLEPFYFWKNRVGIESKLNTGLVYNFINKYNSSFFIDFDLDFAINKFIDLKLSVKSINNTLYNYLDDNEKFSFEMMYEDLLKSFDFFGNGRKQTSFKLSSLSLSAVHYMEDWNLTVTAGQSVKTNAKGKKEFQPEVSVMIQWNAIPELKVKSKWDSENKWSED